MAPSEKEKERVLAAFRSPDACWKTVAKSNEVSRSTAYRVVQQGRAKALPRGGAKEKCTKVTPAILTSLQEYLDEDCQYTLKTMKQMVLFDHGVLISESTISRHLIDMLYTVKQTRIEPITCNNEINKAKRMTFAESLLRHHRDGDCITYADETNYNLYCKRMRGRAKSGERAVVILPPSKGANLQIQCAVNAAIGVVHSQVQHGSIKMPENAEFIDKVYTKVKASDKFQEVYSGKKVVIVLDNAPCHNQTEALITPHDDLVILRLAPYSPMCNPIEGCFSVLKALVKDYLCFHREQMNPTEQDLADGNTMTDLRQALLERAALAGLAGLTPALIVAQELHARDAVNAALRGEDMTYGT